MPYQLFDYIPDSTIHTMGNKITAEMERQQIAAEWMRNRPPPPKITKAAICSENPKFCAPPGVATTMALGEESPGGIRNWPCPQRLPGC